MFIDALTVAGLGAAVLLVGVVAVLCRANSGCGRLAE